ncbi:hypothetical protein NIES4103_11820 [Nostoc sp. NIES-4103]|nr:hypothetical protein NIES4103_11820 [Nostoc sp. NIES-4103]
MNKITESQAKYETLTKIPWENNISVVQKIFFTWDER